MSARLLASLADRGIELWVEGSRLRYRAPRGVLTAELLEQLRCHKQDLIAALRDAKPTGLPGESPAVGPLSYGQQALWFIHHGEPQSAAYNVAFITRIVSAVDVEALHRTLQAILDRHPSLRATFPLRDGEPVQYIHAWQAVDFRQVEVPDGNDDALRMHVEQSYREPFQLESGPLLRARLFTCTPESHVLLVTIHHIACDGWSLWILQDEFRVLYQAYRDGRDVSLPAPASTYADFVRWQADAVAGEIGERDEAFWRRQLAAELPVLNLITDRPRQGSPSFRGGSIRFHLPDELSEQLRRLAQAHGATLYMVLLAAFQTLLHRYTGQDDVLVGSPTNGRNRPETTGVVGYFVNLIALRADLSGDPSFRQFLGRVRQTTLDALAHQDFPFPLLVERLRLPRPTDRSPVFQALFALQRPQLFAEAVDLVLAEEGQVMLDWGGLRMEPFELDQQEGQFELSLEMIETRCSLAGVMKYRSDLFETLTIQRMLGHYIRLLESIAIDADLPISALPMTDEVEQRTVLVDWNATRSDYPRQRCIHELFHEQVAQRPNAVAVEFQDCRITYAELNRRANQLAHHLRQQGIGSGMNVGICVPRSVEMVVGLLAVLKAGAAYVPLEPDDPERRIDFVLRDTGAQALLVAPPTADVVPDFDGTRVLLQPQWHEIGGRPVSSIPAENLPIQTRAEELAYVMYTSGSTGQPKGVEVIHRGVVRLVCNTNYVELGPDEVVLQFAPLSFDASTFEIWAALLQGGRLVVFPPRLPSLDDLGRCIRDCGVTTLWLSAGLFRQMVDFGLEHLRGLRQLLTGGDVVPPGHAIKALAALPHCRLINGYGPTENTTFTCCHRMAGPDDVGATVPIGRPIANTRVYVLDQHGRPVPIGVAGELYAAGDGLARGYLGRPELTAQRFLPDPFSSEPDARMYRTGDLVRWRPDGTLEFLGRMDDQVKIRGFRIELGEIESVLASHQAVRETAVVARSDQAGDKRLVAYVVPAADPPASLDELQGFLRKRLPGYMVPAALVTLDKLPLTANGKIDRRRLPEPGDARPHLHAAYVAPRTPAERILAEVWAEVLGLDRVGIHDNFFAIGGASITSLRIVARAQEAGLSADPSLLSPELLFEHPTIAEIASLLEAAPGV